MSAEPNDSLGTSDAPARPSLFDLIAYGPPDRFWPDWSDNRNIQLRLMNILSEREKRAKDSK